MRDLPHGFQVIHVSVDGVRGVDYNMQQTAYVIIGYNVPNLAMFRQCCGRGARHFNQVADVQFVLWENEPLAKARASDLEARASALAAHFEVALFSICSWAAVALATESETSSEMGVRISFWKVERPSVKEACI